MNLFKKIFGQIFGSGQDSDERANNDQTEIAKIENNNPIDEEYLFDLEEKLIRLDCGIEFAEYVVKKLKEEQSSLTVSKAQKLTSDICRDVLKNPLLQTEEKKISNESLSEIILIVGVNGAGKTTSIGKLANRFINEGKKVLIAPCDTFRAAAGDQLQRWAERAGADLYPIQSGKRADTVLYEAIQRAQTENYDILIVDTAGRLQSKSELMEELAKLGKVLDKHTQLETLIQRYLVIDATTGQNGYGQAVAFNEATELTGIILTKFDGTAKGGIVFAICHNLKIPICFIGTGEKLNELIPFDPESFMREIIST
jgi:fused signal recognition particle receptor